MREFDAIGTIAFFRERQRVEALTTAKVLRSLSPEMLGSQPHPHAATIGAIAWTIVRCLCLCNRLTRYPVAEIPRESVPAYAALLAAFTREARDLNVNLMQTTQLDWEMARTVRTDKRVVLQQPLGQILWLFHANAIHHRGQLSVFLRPFGAGDLALYGPSGACPPSASTAA